MIIDLIHFIIILFIILIPFLNNKKWIEIKILYLFIIPIMWLHWYMCFGHCALTLLDNYLNNRDLFSNEGFVYNFLDKIFSLTNSDIKTINYLIWLCSILLWIKVYYDTKLNIKKKIINFIKKTYKKK